MEFSKITELLAGEPKYRLTQVNQAVFSDLAENWDDVTALPKILRERLKKECPMEIPAEISVSAGEDTVKALLKLSDGKFIETVLMRHEDGRNTVCVSSMVGCPMKCAFCATGEMGLMRKLTADEIITQVLFFARLLKKENERVGSVVFMGMGEPFLNYDNVMNAVRTMNSPEGFGIGARHISISTCGIFDGIKKLAKEDLALNLAISLHSSDDEVRRQLMPVAHGYEITELLAVIDEYIAATNRKVMFEYLLISGVNDTDEMALELAKLLKNKLCVVNLIQYNDTGAFIASSHNRMNRFKEILEVNGIQTTMRYRFGRDIKGACGQLATGRN
ncbi:MAG: 23S rRNA (adenine(2503)-C(2))-methyltransferase RlmN [Candidatus Paceibacterota bacterium]|jgi:23S rRNA (adenine2503-C2)-methyltransferase|nr:23S rRNA (adenine(2503)-C(2))-methyltransferase RlmN [Candidatus Paceibacterota bacterium]